MTRLTTCSHFCSFMNNYVFIKSLILYKVNSRYDYSDRYEKYFTHLLEVVKIFVFWQFPRSIHHLENSQQSCGHCNKTFSEQILKMINFPLTETSTIDCSEAITSFRVYSSLNSTVFEVLCRFSHQIFLIIGKSRFH